MAKCRTKQTTEQLYKQVDGVWTEAEATAKKVSANVKEKITAAKEEAKETFGIGKQESFESSGASSEPGAEVKTESKAASGEEGHQQSGPSDAMETLFGKFKSTVSSASPKVSMAFQKIKEAKVIDIAKKGYDVVKDEITGSPGKRKHIQYDAIPSSKVERSARTDIVVVPSKHSHWSKKWETLKGKMRGHPIFKHISGLSDPVVIKSQENWQIAEDMREKWETIDHPFVHKVQDLNESVFGETAAAESFKEIRRRDPSFSLPDFVAEVEEVVKPTLRTLKL